MAIGILNSTGGFSSAGFPVLPKASEQKTHTENLGADPVAVSTAAPLVFKSAALSQYLTQNSPTMSIDPSSGHSKYVQASLNSYAVAGQIANSKNNSMVTMLQQFGGMSISGTYFGPASDFTPNDIAEKVKDKKGEDVWKSSEELLEEAIEDIQERADEAAMPTDNNGNPIPTDENGRPLLDKDGNPVVVGKDGTPVEMKGGKPSLPEIKTPTVTAADVAPTPQSAQGGTADSSARHTRSKVLLQYTSATSLSAQATVNIVT